jgi:peptidoglycan/xylan/chitin deacetylase (PgdA/CDA1 family)
MLQALGEGHELGCHTHDHLDAWFSSRAEYLASVRRNAEAWAKLAPAAEFATFAYPKSGPTVWVKGDLSERFLACRGGGQCGNEGTVDLNLVQACFLDGRTRIQMDQVRMLIDRNASSSGWLVFATHDVADDPSPYGCKLGFFERVVEYAVQSGAAILPFGTAAKALLP